MYAIDKKTKALFRENIKSIDEFKVLVNFTKENDDSGLELELVGHADELIRLASELSASKTEALDGLISESVLGVKKARADIYAQKNTDAEAGEYDDEPEEKTAIIAKHKAQLEAEKQMKQENNHLYRKIEEAYKGILNLVENREFEKAEKAMSVFATAGVDTTNADIENAIS